MIQYLSQQNPEIFRNKKVLVRLDLNVPITDGSVLTTDASRIHASLPTLRFLQDAGASITIISHIGRKPGESLEPVVEYMRRLIPATPQTPSSFAAPSNSSGQAHDTPPYKGGDTLRSLATEQSTEEILPLPRGGGTEHSEVTVGSHEITILPNLRSNPGEELNDTAFAASLCEDQDYYINDAFAVSHRAHASVVGVPTLMGHERCFAGFQLEHEIEFLNKALHPASPSLLIMGGAKFETKLPVIETLLPLVDHIIIGGALLNNFLKSSGVDIGDSLIDPDAHIDHLVHNPKITIPDNLVWEDNKILDIDPEYFQHSDIGNIIKNAQTIIWNGPMGYYEGGFTAGTETLTRLLAESTGTKIIGGGDSVALIEQLKLSDKFDFLSTGGGAMLEYLGNNGSLPGIDVLK
jgi:3-phosphoglycerate kinase